MIEFSHGWNAVSVSLLPLAVVTLKMCGTDIARIPQLYFDSFRRVTARVRL
jgi:hypothetical protein